MNRRDVTVVRIYLTEGDRLLRQLLERLHDHEQVMGVTVFRGTTGFGRSGRMHGDSLLDVSFDLPLVVEFFDTPQRVEEVLDHIGDWFGPGHILSWNAVTNV
ncbi:MAG TPA: DUF190 domain-containing protein [Gammaproteobacteria bacterium]|nr:DUF190 domain-containing protein [Gammaproteobacteria bacterium]